jgi:hypothetical protein
VLGHRFFRIGIASACLILASPGLAHAAGWQEIHQTADDVRFDVAADGIATVEHHLRYRIVAGRFKTIDVVGLDPRGEMISETVVTNDKGGAETIGHVEPVAKAPGAYRIVVDDAKGLGRGSYAATVKYRLDLVATKMLSRDGAMWKLAWTLPPVSEGQDGARVVFDFPAAPTEPRLAAGDASATTLTTLRRSTEQDEIELVRAHVPRGEAATWALRVDPKAFPRVTAPDLRPPPPPAPPAPSLLDSNLSRVLVALGLAALAGGLAALLRDKQGAVRRAAALRNATARPLVPIAHGIGPFVYGVVTTLAFATLLWSSPVLGALLVVGAMALAAHRAPLPIVRPRGPGSWRPLSDPRALLKERPTPLPTDAFDLGAAKGRAIFALLCIAVAALSWGLRSHVPQFALALPLASAALLPLFITGTRAQMPPSPTELAATFLRDARDRLAKATDVSHVELDAIVREIDEGGAFDEIRLVCAPRDRTPGLRAIELALAMPPGGRVALPEILVRFDEGSAVAPRILQLASRVPVVPGRTPEERVARLAPPEATPARAAAYLADLLMSLEGRRSTDRRAPAPARPWKGKDRRARALRPSPPVPAL